MVGENSSGSNGRGFDASMYRVGQGANVDRLGWRGKKGWCAERFDETKLEERMTLVAYSLEKFSIIQSLDRISMLEIFFRNFPLLRSVSPFDSFPGKSFRFLFVQRCTRGTSSNEREWIRDELVSPYK